MSKSGKLCICQQHPGQRRVALLPEALCSRARRGLREQREAWLGCSKCPGIERPGQMGQQMGKEAEPPLICSAEKTLSLATPSTEKKREGTERETQTLGCTVKQGETDI